MSKIPSSVKALLVAQLALELSAQMAYKNLSAIADLRGFDGVTAWANKASAEEATHWNKYIDYLADRNEISETEPFPAPVPYEVKTVTSIADVFSMALAMEKKVTVAIEAIAQEAVKTGDLTTLQFLGWFLEEQVASEKEVDTYLRQVKDIGDNKPALRLWDAELLESLGD